MRRLLPYPILATALLAMWLLLNGTLSPGGILLGAVIALVSCWALVALRPPRARFRRPWVALSLARVVLAEIVRSNFAVARILLRRGSSQHSSGFVVIPLELRDPYGLAVLATIITATPGTVWVEYDSARSTMMMHVLDLVDPQEWLHTIKHEYEARLREMFE